MAFVTIKYAYPTVYC